MKAILILTLAGTAMLAQTPPPAKSATKGTATKSVTPAARRGNLLNPAALRARAPELFRVRFTTTKGDFVVEVNRAWAPLGSDRFYNLVRNGYFTNAAFFRVMPGFIVQFGMHPDPAVGKVWQNANIRDDKATETNARGTLVFATAGPNTRTTQLFINLANNKPLDADGFAPFGKVTEGMEVVTAINSEYGERPDQNAIRTQGNAYLDKNFPRLDKIKSATIISPEAPPPPPPPVKKPAPAAKK